MGLPTCPPWSLPPQLQGCHPPPPCPAVGSPTYTPVTPQLWGRSPPARAKSCTPLPICPPQCSGWLPPTPLPLHAPIHGSGHVPVPFKVAVGGVSGGSGSLLRQRELQDPLQLLFLLACPELGFLLLPRRQRHGQAELLRIAGEQGAGPPAAPPRGWGDGGTWGRCVLGSPGGRGMDRRGRVSAGVPTGPAPTPTPPGGAGQTLPTCLPGGPRAT